MTKDPSAAPSSAPASPQPEMPKEQPSGVPPATPASNQQSVDVALVMAFVTQLRQIFASPSYRPPLLPTVALKVHELSFRSDVNVDQLVAVLEKDSILAAQVLRVAGSAAYGAWDAEPTLKGAVVRLGLRNLASVVWEVAVGMRIFRSARYEGLMEQIRVHSTVCAHICRMIATRKGPDPEQAFLCGLLHDIGMAATLLVLADRPKDDASISPAILDEVLRQTHQEVSGMIAQLWTLPSYVQSVLSNHHRLPATETPDRLAALVVIGEHLSHSVGYGVSIGPGQCDLVEPDAVSAAYGAVGVSQDERASLEEAAKDVASTATLAAQTESKRPAPDAAPGTPSSTTSPAHAVHSAPRPASPHQARRDSWWRKLRRFVGL